MLYLIHGDDYPKTRLIVVELFKKSKLENKIEIDLAQVSVEALSNILASQELFAESKCILIDITDEKRIKDINYVDILKTSAEQDLIILWAKKKLGTTNIFVKNLKHVKIVENPITAKSNIFRFIDALFQKDRLQTYKNFKLLIQENQDMFYIFTMILYGLRNLGIIKFNSKLQSKLPGFTLNKLKKTGQLYSGSDYISLHNYIYDLEKNIKTGKITIENGLTLIIEKVVT